jgi:hypothetical protein
LSVGLHENKNPSFSWYLSLREAFFIGKIAINPVPGELEN